VRVALGTDERSALSDALAGALRDKGHTVVAVADPLPWPEAGRAVGEAVAEGRADRGVVCCWTGTGVAIAANKVPGIRAALCTDAVTAEGARRWNDANVLALSLRLVTPTVGAEILEAFLTVEADDGESDTIARLP
jgi:ribose 5-phosphate isomerase B